MISPKRGRLRCALSACFVATLVAADASANDAPDPPHEHRWYLPQRGARDQSRDEAGPIHAEWNPLGVLVNRGKQKLASLGIRFDTDLTFFYQYANEVVSRQQNFGTFSWRIMGDWELLDLEGEEPLSGIGKSYVGWTAFGTAGLGYNPRRETLTGNVGALNTLNATVFDPGAVLDELFWKQVALGGKLLLLGGKLDLAYHFDTNRVANDGYTEFFSYSLQNNPSIPAPLYGGFGGIVRGNLPRDTYVMFGAGDSSMDTAVVPWTTLDNDSWYQLLELGWSPTLPVLGKGNYRLTPWHNHLFGEDGWGFGLNIDQELGRKDIVAFFRFGYGDQDVTPVKTFASGGVAWLDAFGQKGDRFALGVAWSDPSRGSGLRAETLLELQYSLKFGGSITLTPDLQLVFDPSSQPGTEVVVVPGLRLLLAF